MTTRKKILVITGISVLVLGVLGIGFIAVGGASGIGPSFKGHCFGSKFRHGGFHQDIGEFILWRMDKSSGELNLAQDQQAAYQSFRDYLESIMTDVLPQKAEMKRAIHMEMENGSPDLLMVTGRVKTHVDDMYGHFSAALEKFEQFYATLDAGQQKQITDRIKERMKAHGCGIQPDAG